MKRGTNVGVIDGTILMIESIEAWKRKLAITKIDKNI